MTVGLGRKAEHEPFYAIIGFGLYSGECLAGGFMQVNLQHRCQTYCL